MSTIQKQGAISTIINYAGVIIAYLNLIFVLPYFLTLETIGLLRLIIELATLATLIFQLGSPYLVIRYFPEYQERNQELRSFFTASLILGLLGFCLLVIFFILFQNTILGYFSEKSELILDYKFSFIAIAFSMILFNVLERVFGTQKLIVIPVAFKEIINRLGLTLVAVLLGLSIVELEGGIRVWIVVYAFGTLALLFLYKKKFGLKFSISPHVWNKKSLMKFAKYAGIVSVGSIGGGLSIKIDMLMTGSMLGLKELGIYATMVYIATVIEIPKRALIQISDPFISEFHAEGNTEKIGSLYKKNSIILLVLGMFIFLLIYFNLNHLFVIMPKGDLFRSGINVFAIIAIVKLLGLLSGISNQILVNSKEAWASSATIILLAIMSIALNFYFIPLYGMEGAALATLISVGFNYLLVMVYVYLKFHLHPFGKEMLYLLAAFAVVFGIVLLLPDQTNPFFGFALNSVVICSLYPLIIYKLKISPDANEMGLKVLNKVKKIIGS